MYRICLVNRITEIKNDFKCNLCDCLFKKNLDSVLNHIEGEQHNTMLCNLEFTVGTSDELDTISKAQQRNIVQNLIIFYDNNSFECLPCHCKVGFSNIFQHIKGRRHQTSFKTMSQFALPEKNNLSIQNEIQTPSIGTQESKQIISKSVYADVFYCETCRVYLNQNSKLQCHIMTHLYQEINFPWHVDIIKLSTKKDKTIIIKCLLCNIFILNDQNLPQHLNTKIHAERLRLLSVKCKVQLDDMEDIKIDNKNLSMIESEKIRSNKINFCIICDVPVPKSHNDYNLNIHEKGRNHIKNILKSTVTENKNVNETNENIDDWSCYVCFLCKLSFCNVSLLLSHYNENQHKSKIKSLAMINKDPYINFFNDKKEIIKCLSCQNIFTDCNTAVTHLLGKKHSKKVLLHSKNLSSVENINENNTVSETIDINKETSESLINIIDKTNNQFTSSSEKLIKSSFESKNMNEISNSKSNHELNNLLESLINLDLRSTQKKKLPLSLIKRNPQKNLKTRNNAFIIKEDTNIIDAFFQICIYPGERNIYKADIELIRMIQLGCSLICPYNSEIICLACGYELKNDKICLFEHLQQEEHIKNLYTYEIDDKSFEEFPDEFSDLRLAKSYMMEKSDTIIQCFACNVNVNSENQDISLHIKESKHCFQSKFNKQFSDQVFLETSTILNDMWIFAQNFYCEVCDKSYTFEIDFIEHILKKGHLKESNELQKRGTTLNYGMCPICAKFWYGMSNYYSHHCKEQIHRYYIRNVELLVPKMTEDAIDLLKNVDKRIAFLISQSDKAESNSKEFMQHIKETIADIYPNAAIYTFGSRISYLGFPDSDVDVFIDCNNNYITGLTQQQCQQYLLSMQKCFKEKRNIWILEELVLEAKVPILKVKYRLSGQDCDISCNSGISVEKSKLIGYYTAAFPNCRKLILYLKKWLQFCQISGSDSITTFAISWFVIFYLQISGIFPSVYKLIKGNNQSKIVDGWECGFKTIPEIHSDLSFKEHLRKLFSYFADFDYKTNVICPYLGKVIEKKCFTSIDGLPNEMDIYKCRLKIEPITFRWDSAMCIQDPVDQSLNITKAVKKQNLRYFKEYSKYSAKIV